MGTSDKAATHAKQPTTASVEAQSATEAPVAKRIVFDTLTPEELAKMRRKAYAYLL